MKLIIDIPKYIADMCKECGRVIDADTEKVGKAIKNGTPLPKGHGRLIDADAFISVLKDASKRQKYKELLIDDFLTVDDVFKAVIESLQNRGLAEGDAQTIIEADKGEGENKE